MGKYGLILSQSFAGFLEGVNASGTHKVSGHERKNGRFHAGILHWRKVSKMQTIHRTTENSKDLIFYIQMSTQFLTHQERYVP